MGVSGGKQLGGVAGLSESATPARARDATTKRAAENKPKVKATRRNLRVELMITGNVNRCPLHDAGVVAFCIADGAGFVIALCKTGCGKAKPLPVQPTGVGACGSGVTV